MQNLIKALTILSKYDNPVYPTHCEHDILYIIVNPSLVSEEDITILGTLSVYIHESGECFFSTKYGSA